MPLALFKAHNGIYSIKEAYRSTHGTEAGKVAQWEKMLSVQP